jgi:Ca-activated chloride channel family protein
VRFAAPYWLLLLLLLPLLAREALRRGRRARLPHPRVALQVAAGLPPGRGAPWRHLPLALRLLALGLVIVALARPQVGVSGLPATTLGVDIVVALDISGSMAAPDFPPDRLGAAKAVVADFVKGRPDDRIALVLFAGHAFTRVPLTLDHAMLATMLGQVRLGLVEDGTAIGEALAASVGRLADSKAASRVIVLLTDGNNNRGQIDPLTAADLARRLGIRVYTVGVGSQGWFVRMENDPILGQRPVQVEARVDEKLLATLAERTGGRFFRARDTEALARIYRRIDALEKSPLPTETRLRYADRYAWPAAGALLVVLLEWTLAQTRLRRVPS